MITKKQSQLVKSLQQKKIRKKEQLFIVEGAKSVLELLQSDFKTRTVYATSLFSQEYGSQFQKANVELLQVSPQVLSGLGTFKTNDAALAVVEMKPNLPLEAGPDEYALMLDELNDPGNLGTIIRIADWFGIRKIICSENTVDYYNPKAIAAAKGSFTRVQLYYTALAAFIRDKNLPVLGADLDGKDVHEFDFPPAGYLLMGSEANGISAEVQALLGAKISIKGRGGAESLNVAMATAIICDNLQRILKK